MIDWKRVLALHDEVGEAEFRLLVELFLDEIEGVMMSLDTTDPEILEQRLHFLKGNAWNLGLQAFGAQCALWETMVIRGHTDSLEVDRLLDCYAQSKQVLMRDLDRVLDRRTTGVA